MKTTEMVLVIALASSAGFVGGLLSVSFTSKGANSPSAELPGVVQTQELQIVDSQGAIQAKLGQNRKEGGGEWGLYLYDSKGNVRAQLSLSGAIYDGGGLGTLVFTRPTGRASVEKVERVKFPSQWRRRRSVLGFER